MKKIFVVLLVTFLSACAWPMSEKLVASMYAACEANGGIDYVRPAGFNPAMVRCNNGAEFYASDLKEKWMK